MLSSQSPSNRSRHSSWRRVLFLPMIIMVLMLSSISLLAQSETPCSDPSCTDSWKPRTRNFPASAVPGCPVDPSCIVTVHYLTRSCDLDMPCEFYLTNITFSGPCDLSTCSMANIVQTAIKEMISDPIPGSGCDIQEGTCINNVKVTAADCFKAVYDTDGKIIAVTPCHAIPSCCVAKYRICRSGGQIVIYRGSISSPHNPTCPGHASPFPSTECTPICQYMDFGL